MNPIKRSDVKNHLHSPFLTRVHTTKADPLGFAQDFVAEHSSSDVAVAPSDPLTGSIRPQASAVSKSARA